MEQVSDSFMSVITSFDERLAVDGERDVCGSGEGVGGRGVLLELEFELDPEDDKLCMLVPAIPRGRLKYMLLLGCVHIFLFHMCA